MEPRLKASGRVRGTAHGMDAAARAMRRDLTPAERSLWNALRNRQVAGLKFRRQHPVGVYVLDFCCPERKLVVEVDGSIHRGQIEYDLARTEWLERFGYRVLRFRNEDVLSDLRSVLSVICNAIAGREGLA